MNNKLLRVVKEFEAQQELIKALSEIAPCQNEKDCDYLSTEDKCWVCQIAESLKKMEVQKG